MKFYLVDNMCNINLLKSRKDFKINVFPVQIGDSKSGIQEVQGSVWDILLSQKPRKHSKKNEVIKRP